MIHNKKINKMTFLKTLCSALLTLLSFDVYAGIGEELVKLRSQVQLEADSLEAEKKAINSSIQSLTVEKGELESQKKLLTQANRQYAKSLKEKEQILGGEELKGFEGYAEMADQGIKALTEYFSVAVPFKVNKRKERLLKLQEKYKKKELTVAEYFEKYWSVLQDEIRLSENVEIQNDSVFIENVEHKVKVLKLGMFGLYFKTLDGRLGFAKKSSDAWTFEFFSNSNHSKNVALLFASKEKQIKGGAYTLPLMISEGVQDVL